MSAARKSFDRAIACFVVGAIGLLPGPTARGATVIVDRVAGVFPLDLTPGQIHLDVGRA